jgi:drug/metabolite transporter, DME family
MKLSPHTTARLYLVAGAVLWSTGGFFIKEIDAGATSITFFRCLFAGLLLAPVVAGRRFPGASDMLVSIVLFALLLGLYVGATKETTAANAIFLQYTAPLYVIALAPAILGERLRSSDVVPFAICLTGIAVLFIGNWGSGDVGGLLLGAGSGFFYGLFLIWLRRITYADPIAITFANCMGVAVLFSFALLKRDVDVEDLSLLFVMGAVQFALPYLLFTRGLRDVESAEASLLALIEPVLNPVWVALFYGEQPTVATVIGGAIIIAGLAVRYTIIRESPRAEATLEPPRPAA